MGASDYRDDDEYVIYIEDIPGHSIAEQRIRKREEDKQNYNNYSETHKKKIEMENKIRGITENIKQLNTQIEITKKNIEYCQQNSGTDPGKLQKLQAGILALESTLKEHNAAYEVLEKTSNHAYEKYYGTRSGKTNGGRRRAKTHRRRRSTYARTSKRLRRRTARASAN